MDLLDSSGQLMIILGVTAVKEFTLIVNVSES